MSREWIVSVGSCVMNNVPYTWVVWMNLVYERVIYMSHMNESYECVTYVNKSYKSVVSGVTYDEAMSEVPYEWVIWISHVYEWVMSQDWSVGGGYRVMSNVTCEWVICMSHVFGWVMSQEWIVGVGMGWLWLVGSITLYVSLATMVSFISSFAKDTYNFIDPTITKATS